MMILYVYKYIYSEMITVIMLYPSPKIIRVFVSVSVREKEGEEREIGPESLSVCVYVCVHHRGGWISLTGVQAECPSPWKSIPVHSHPCPLS